MTATKTLTQLADELEAAIASGEEQEQRRVAAAFYRRLVRSQDQSILYHRNVRYRATTLWDKPVIHRTPYPKVLEYIPAQEIIT